MKSQEALAVWKILSQAKYSKMSDADKVKAWKACRSLKSAATAFEDACKDAAQSMKPDGDYDGQLRRAMQYEQHRDRSDMTDEEYRAFLDDFKKYNTLVGDAVREYGEKEVEVSFEPLSDEAFGALMASNDWNMQQADMVGDYLLA